jgi:hypothetical protein
MHEPLGMATAATDCPDGLDRHTFDFYARSLRQLRAARVPFLVGGAYAFERYTGIARHTKDFDVFVRKQDCRRALDVLAAGGCRAEVAFAHWLAKAFHGDDFIDVIFSSGNGIATVDDAWFQHAVDAVVLGVPVKLCPPEEIIWSKAFIMERERYDGADIAHLLRATAAGLDWRRLLDRFGPHWRVLLSHLVLFGFIYPHERTAVPAWVTAELVARLQAEAAQADDGERVCRGTILSRGQYLADVDRWGYRDGRLPPEGCMSEGEIAHWTAAFHDER